MKDGKQRKRKGNKIIKLKEKIYTLKRGKTKIWNILKILSKANNLS